VYVHGPSSFNETRFLLTVPVQYGSGRQHRRIASIRNRDAEGQGGSDELCERSSAIQSSTRALDLFAVDPTLLEEVPDPSE